jgi:hypothetical protein
MGTPVPGASARTGRPGGKARTRPPLDPHLIGRVRPLSGRGDQLLPVLPALSPVFPGGGLQRGTVVTVHRADHGGAPVGGGAPVDDALVGEGAPVPRILGEISGGSGTTTLALALLVGASARGSWCAAVGLDDVGVVTMAELGMALDRLAVIPRPGPHWPEVSAVLFDGMDIVLIRPSGTVRPSVARRLTARVRERQVALVVLCDRGRWPGSPETRMTIAASAWEGVGLGYGHLRRRRGEVVVTGRGAAVRSVRAELWLPGPTGTVADG